MKKTAILLLLALLGSTAHAQPVMKFDSGPGFRLPVLLDSIATSFRDRLDLNGDGNPEMVLRRLDEMDNPVEMVVVDLAAGGQEIWTLAFRDISAGLGSGVVGLMGFFDINADGIKEAVFRSREKLAIFTIDLAGGKHSAADPFVLSVRRAAVRDLDGDGLLEVIIENSETRTVQIWGSSSISTATEDEAELPRDFALAPNYPNPFNPQTTIRFDLPAAMHVRMVVYNAMGQEVARLVDEPLGAGTHAATWDASGFPSGTYLYRLTAGVFSQTKAMILLK